MQPLLLWTSQPFFSNPKSPTLKRIRMPIVPEGGTGIFRGGSPRALNLSPRVCSGTAWLYVRTLIRRDLSFTPSFSSSPSVNLRAADATIPRTLWQYTPVYPEPVESGEHHQQTMCALLLNNYRSNIGQDVIKISELDRCWLKKKCFSIILFPVIFNIHVQFRYASQSNPE